MKICGARTLLRAFGVLSLIVVTNACGKHDFYSYGDSSFSGPSTASSSSGDAHCPNPIPLDTFDMPEISSSHRWSTHSSGSWKLMRKTIYVLHELSGNSFVGEVRIERHPMSEDVDVSQRLLCNGVSEGHTMSASTRTVESISRFDGYYSEERSSEFRVNEFGGITLESGLSPRSGYALPSTGSVEGIFSNAGNPAVVSSRLYRRSYREVEIRVRVSPEASVPDHQRMTMNMAYVYQLIE